MMNLKVIALPFAGGNMYSYNFLRTLIEPRQIEVVALEYPGRGRRMGEPLLESLEEIVADILEQLLPEVSDSEYVIYGHSMGGLVGYLLCQEIAQRGLKKPLKLIVSGSAPPSVREDDKIHHLPSEGFWEKMMDLGGIPDELLAEPALKILFEKILRADFKAIEEYHYAGKANLAIPIDVFYGSKEKEKDIAQIDEWKGETNKPVRIIRLPGNHFFIHAQALYLSEQIIQAFRYIPARQR